jgi:hypothetical protein
MIIDPREVPHIKAASNINTAMGVVTIRGPINNDAVVSPVVSEETPHQQHRATLALRV